MLTAVRRAAEALLRHQGLRAWTTGLLLLALGAGCVGTTGGSSAARSAESQSLAEYDVARDLWLTRHRAREALSHVLEAIELDSDNAEAEHLAALILLDFCQSSQEECRLEQVEHHARRALKLQPKFREARNTLGVSLVHQERPAEAVEVLKPLTEDILYKTPEVAWGNLGWALLELGRTEQAVAALTRSVTAQPQFCVGHFRLGLAYEALNKPTRARDAFTLALETAEGRCVGLQEAYLGRARASIALHQPESALEDLKTCIQLAQNTAAGRQCDLLQNQIAP